MPGSRHRRDQGISIAPNVASRLPVTPPVTVKGLVCRRTSQARGVLFSCLSMPGLNLSIPFMVVNQGIAGQSRLLWSIAARALQPLLRFSPLGFVHTNAKGRPWGRPFAFVWRREGEVLIRRPHSLTARETQTGRMVLCCVPSL